MQLSSESGFVKFIKLSLCFWLFVVSVLFSANSYAAYDGERSVNFSDGRCRAGSLDFSPFSNNKDINWELTNPTCIGFIAGTAVALQIAETASSYACLQPQLAAEAAAQHASGVPMSPAMIKRRAQEASTCGALLSAQSYGQAALCCGGMAATLATTAIAVGVLATIWDQAGITFESARICGHNWTKWENQTKDDGSTLWVKTKGPHLLCLENLFLGTKHTNVGSCTVNDSTTSLSITNQAYREFIYGGVEYEDNGSACENPSSWDADRRNEILGYSSTNQRYYMTGPAAPPVYACYRFKANPKDEADREAMQIAYDCCKRRSQESICIENRKGFNYATSPTYGSYEHGFCSLGSRCTVAGIVFEVYESKKKSNYGCAKTYSVCPYNHLIGGGTEVEDLNADDQSKINNYCQVMNHCSKLPILPYIYTSNLDGGYVAEACRDMKGDSQNVYGYSAQLLPINTRGFSAPMVQCFKETMENIFLHKAGRSECSNPDEKPIEDVCVSGYIYQKGGDLPGKSFFLKIQDNLQEVIKMALTASIVAFGIAILMAVPGAHITKKVLFTYVLKIGLIMYFAVGDAWQFGFMKGIIGTSSFMADLAFKVDESKPQEKLDGCQFPRFNYADDNPSTKYNHPQYPPTKEYLKIWDILDCKIARALGFGPEVSVPNLVMAIIGGFFTGGLGIVFVVATFIFSFFLISMTIKAMHVFIMSMTSVVILLYVSPITITMAFFERTKGIFNNWWKQLLGFTLQPMVLFAYMGILVSLLDAFILGSATFTPSQVNLNGQIITDTYGRMAPKQISCSGDASDDSLYCIFRISEIKNFDGFEAIGIGIPLLTSVNSAKLSTIIKVAMIMFIFSSFMDKISEFAAKLVGGAELKPSWGGSTSDLVGKAYGIARGVQERGVQAIAKHGGNIARGTINKGKDIASAVSNRGRKQGDVDGAKGTDSVTSNKGLGEDSTGSKKIEGIDSGSSSTDSGSDNATTGASGSEKP
jgi:hypothetical protein